MSIQSRRSPATLFEKIWQAHAIAEVDGGKTLLFVDRHLVYEVSSGRAFARLRDAGRRVRNPELTFATIDHVVSTAPGRTAETFAPTAPLVAALRRNCEEFSVRLFDLNDRRQGIVHVVVPELGLALPGSMLVCSDSHTSTVGALGVLGWGVGISESEHVLATQTIVRSRPKTMRLVFNGRAGPKVSAKDLVLHAIGRLGTGAGRGYVVEYAGPVVEALPVEGRLTICNMSVELGARAGLMAPDDTLIEYLDGREFAPKGKLWDEAVAYWRALKSDPESRFDREETIECGDMAPAITWGTSPQDVVGIDGRVPNPAHFPEAPRREAAKRAIDYMGLVPGMALEGLKIDVVFIGSCTNGRLSDLREAAAIVEGRKVAPGVRALVVPGSKAVKSLAEAEGLHRIFLDAGFEWREPGCSMCLALNDDRVPPGSRCVSSTNRNFEGRQGDESRTHLASPATAAASAIAGAIADPRKI